VTKCLLTFKKVKEELGTDKPVIQINMVLTNRNFDQVVAMVEYARRVGCEELAFHPMREYEEIKSQVRKLKLTLKQKTRLRVYMARAKKLAQSYGLLLDLGMVPELQTDGGLIPKFLRARCYEPFYGLLVDPEGKVTHCIPHGMGIEELDLKKMNMEEIWYGDYFAKVRQKILNGIMMKCCLKCGLLDMSEELRTDLGLFIRHGE
jgi:MoaA/NifB/PqqE/SkfB family radical SAM enzyme